MQRSPFRVIAALILIVVVGLVVFGAYQAGLAVGAGAGPGTAAAAAPYGMRFWGWGWGWGFPLFFHPLGFLFGLFFLFLIFWIVRALFWGGRGHRGDWHGSWEDRRRDAFEAWHREAHTRGEPHGHDDPPPAARPGDGPTS
jgi:hypothetical protein